MYINVKLSFIKEHYIFKKFCETVFVISSKRYYGQTSVPKLVIKKPTVVYSPFHDIYENLAAENWIYKHVDFTEKRSRLLMLWSNNPCIVIGRHQNVFAECNVATAIAGHYCQCNV